MSMQANNKAEGDLRRLILDTARHLLVTDGYPSLSMRKIARQIGYSATSIYLHFQNKDALVHALIDEGMERMYAAFLEAAATHPEHPLARLEALCRCYIQFGLDNAEYYEIMYLLHPEDMARYPAEKYRRARRSLEVIVDTLTEGAAKGLLMVTSPLLAAHTIWASLHGAVSLFFSGRMDVRVDREAFIETLIAQTIGFFMPALNTAPG